MGPYLLLGVAALLPVIFAVGFFVLDHYTPFKKMKQIVKQIIYGVVFGFLAIFGTHFGIEMNGAVVNTRDACVIIAGLFMGWPSGIIAGTIGGLERFFGVYWFGLGSFTQTACSVSTFIAGVASALLRKFMFKNKRASLFPAFLLAFVIETFHLFMVFVTNASDYVKAFAVVESCTPPMLIANSLSVLVAGIILDAIEYKKQIISKTDRHSLNTKFQLRMGVLVVLSFLLSSTFLYMFQNQVADQETIVSLNNAINDTDQEIQTLTITDSLNQRVGDKGFVAVFDSAKHLKSITNGLSKDDYLADLTLYINFNPSDELSNFQIDGVQYYAKYSFKNNNYIVAAIPVSEADLSRDIAIYVNTFLEIIVFGLIFINMYLIVTNIVNKRLDKINDSLSEITSGNLDTVVDGGDITEFKTLSRDINLTVDALKGYIEDAKARIDKELALAKDIQISTLPHVTEEFTSRKEFDVCPFMQTAKEVGGDFYDFYFNSKNRFSILVADVSGKGIPAAMFMMRARTVLKTLTQSGIGIDKVFYTANNNLCKGNEAGMFVTAWQATIDLDTGLMQFVNAGHNPPLVMHKGGKYEFLRTKPNLVLASFEDYNFHHGEYTLEPGDTIFLYTDGVTESINDKTEQYGEKRLLKILNSKKYKDCASVVKSVVNDLGKFVGEVEQFDDITMLSCTFYGKEEN